MTDYIVTSEAELDSDLVAMAGSTAANTLTLDDGFTLTQDLTAINLGSGGSLAITGNGETIDGDGDWRGFMVIAGTVTLSGLTIADTTAVGGAGGSARWSGGGGAGLGGGLFVASGGAVTLNDVTFSGDSAVGGAGGTGATGGAVGGGGGLGGTGGVSQYGGGGGGIGSTATGGGGNGAGGIVPGVAGLSNGLYASGAYGGGGAAGGYNESTNTYYGGGGGGIGGLAGGARQFDNDVSGGNGGFGGGGGGGGGAQAGTGGFGGGGGGAFFQPGAGGFGGGGGGDDGAGAGGGFGAGAGAYSNGGGGLGAGGAVFVQAGATLSIGGGAIAGGSATGGTGGQSTFFGDIPAGSGSGFGSGIFLQGNQTISLAPGLGQTLDISDVIADQTGSTHQTGDSAAGDPLAGAGSLLIDGAGTVVLSAVNTYTGGTTIDAGATLDLASTGAGGGSDIIFAGAGMLDIAADVTVANTIEGFASEGDLDFAGITPGTDTTATLSGDVLTVTDGTHTQTVTLAAGQTHTSFATSSDDDGGTVVACYVAGTAIAAPSGDVPIERLRIGDLVCRHAGDVRPVKWIGHRAYGAAFVAANPQLRPVRIRAGALGQNLPLRDLLVSPCHAVLIEGMLIPAASLVNGVSITREAPGEVRYLHVELHDASLVLAEGAAAESFVDCAGRMMFQNAAEYFSLYPDEAPAAPVLPAPRIEHGFALEAARLRLAGVAAAPGRLGQLCGHVEGITATAAGVVVEGWAVDGATPDFPVALHILAPGLRPMRVLANRYRADLDRAGIADGRGGFRAILPVGTRGITVRRAGDGARLGGQAEVLAA